MKHVQIRLEDHEFEQVDSKRHELRYGSLQQALKAAVLRWAGKAQPSAPSRFIEVAAKFENSAPEQIRNLIQDNMRRFIEVEQKTPKRRKKAG